MATKLIEVTSNGERIERPVTRVVTDVPYRGTVAITLSADGVVFRGHGKRTRYTLPYGLAMLHAEKLAAAELLAARRAKRAERATFRKRTRRTSLNRGR